MELKQIQDLIDKIQGVTFASLDTVTEVALLGGKANPMKGRVAKVCRGHNIILSASKRSNTYENMVRRRLEAEGKSIDFNVAPLQWGERVGNSPIIENKGKYYLQCHFVKPGSIEYMLDDKIIEKDAIIGLPIEKQGSGRQGLDDEHKVIIRTYALDSIKTIRLFKEEISE